MDPEEQQFWDSLFPWTDKDERELVDSITDPLIDREFERLVPAIRAAEDKTEVMLPGTCHPYYEPRRAEIVRWLEHDKSSQLHVLKPRRFSVADYLDPPKLDMPQTILLDRRKAGRHSDGRMIDWWWIAMDKYGRGVTSRSWSGEIP